MVRGLVRRTHELGRGGDSAAREGHTRKPAGRSWADISGAHPVTGPDVRAEAARGGDTCPMTAWNIDAESAGVGVGAVTLVEGPSFAISATDGDMSAARPHGVFHNDTRTDSENNDNE